MKRSLDTLQRTKWKGAGGAGAKAPGARQAAGQGAGGPAAAARRQAAGQGAQGVQGQGGGGGEEGGGAQRQGVEGNRQARLELRLSERDGVLQQMAHLADAVRQYTGERLLAAWQWFQEVRWGE